LDLVWAIVVWGGITGVICALLAESRGYTPGGGFALGLVLGVFGLIYLALRPKVIEVVPVMPVGPDGSVPVSSRERLDELASLRDDGLITDAEYRLKRSQVIEEI
jgi:hypothetical protein